MSVKTRPERDTGRLYCHLQLAKTVIPITRKRGPKMQCCGNVTIYCGSGSYFGKVLVPFSAQVPGPDPDLFNTLFNNKKFVQNLALSMLEKAALFPKLWSPSLIFGLL
jgi:hypothetical protein